MRRGTTAAPTGSDDVDPKAGLGAAGGVSAAVVRRKELDVLVKLSAIELVLDSVVGEMNLVVEVRQIVLARPVTDLVLVATRSAVAVGATAVGLLQELLVPRFRSCSRMTRRMSRPPCSSRRRASSWRYVA